MNMFEEAIALRGTMEMCGFSQAEMAKKLGVSQSYVANKLRLLRFDKEIQRKILEFGLTERHARTLLRLEGRSELCDALDRVYKEKLNVQRTEALVDLINDSAAPERIGEAEKHKRIDMFKDAIDRSLKNLVSLGIDAKRTLGYYGRKTYITISIDEY